jgi:hypothetical protein
MQPLRPGTHRDNIIMFLPRRLNTDEAGRDELSEREDIRDH